MKKLILLFLLTFCNSFAQDSQGLFDEANVLYKNGKHKEAIALYEQITNNDLASSELYFNLANCYYKLNKVAPAIYNYEKALQLKPTNQDAKNNLVFAKRLTLDRIDQLPQSYFQKLNSAYLKKISVNAWGTIAILFSILSALFSLLYYYAYSTNKKRFFFVFSVLSVLLLITTLVIAYSQYDTIQTTKEGIIYIEEVSVKNEPTNDSDEVFSLHEGTKVFVLDTVDTWTKIKLSNGKIGWMLSEKLREL